MGRKRLGENRHCFVCNALFYAIRAEIKKGGGKYCSRECYSVRDSVNVQKVCVICNNDFLTKPSLVKLGKGKLCSMECSWKWLSQIKKGKTPLHLFDTLIKSGDSPWNKGKRLHYSVWNKNKKGLQIPWNKGTKGIMTAWNKGKEFLKGRLNPNWRGGISKEPYSQEWTEKLKQKIRERDNYQCKYCKMTEEEHLIVVGRVLTVHHIDYDKKNCVESNLMAACSGCNARFNFNRDYWKDLFQENQKALSEI